MLYSTVVTFALALAGAAQPALAAEDGARRDGQTCRTLPNGEEHCSDLRDVVNNRVIITRTDGSREFVPTPCKRTEDGTDHCDDEHTPGGPGPYDGKSRWLHRGSSHWPHDNGKWKHKYKHGHGGGHRGGGHGDDDDDNDDNDDHDEGSGGDGNPEGDATNPEEDLPVPTPTPGAGSIPEANLGVRPPKNNGTEFVPPTSGDDGDDQDETENDDGKHSNNDCDDDEDQLPDPDDDGQGDPPSSIINPPPGENPGATPTPVPTPVVDEDLSEEDDLSEDDSDLTDDDERRRAFRWFG